MGDFFLLLDGHWSFERKNWKYQPEIKVKKIRECGRYAGVKIRLLAGCLVDNTWSLSFWSTFLKGVFRLFGHYRIWWKKMTLVIWEFVKIVKARGDRGTSKSVEFSVISHVNQENGAQTSEDFPKIRENRGFCGGQNTKICQNMPSYAIIRHHTTSYNII